MRFRKPRSTQIKLCCDCATEILVCNWSHVRCAACSVVHKRRWNRARWQRLQANRPPRVPRPRSPVCKRGHPRTAQPGWCRVCKRDWERRQRNQILDPELTPAQNRALRMALAWEEFKTRP